MTPFHWAFGGFLVVVLVLLLLARRTRPLPGEADEIGEGAGRFACSLCGEKFDETQLVEREFISGYTHTLCGRCIASLHGEAASRRLIPSPAAEESRE